MPTKLSLRGPLSRAITAQAQTHTQAWYLHRQACYPWAWCTMALVAQKPRMIMCAESKACLPCRCLHRHLQPQLDYQQPRHATLNAAVPTFNIHLLFGRCMNAMLQALDQLKQMITLTRASNPWLKTGRAFARELSLSALSVLC